MRIMCARAQIQPIKQRLKKHHSQLCYDSRRKKRRKTCSVLQASKRQQKIEIGLSAMSLERNRQRCKVVRDKLTAAECSVFFRFVFEFACACLYWFLNERHFGFLILNHMVGWFSYSFFRIDLIPFQFEFFFHYFGLVSSSRFFSRSLWINIFGEGMCQFLLFFYSNSRFVCVQGASFFFALFRCDAYTITITAAK